MTALNAWHAWQEAGRLGKWAHNHFLNHRTLLRAADIRAQLTHHLRCRHCTMLVMCSMPVVIVLLAAHQPKHSLCTTGSLL